ncbi:putative oxidoreductase CzcO [Mycobacteroides franklinii]|uniref:Putative oxidoreductase CzcO n=2 Tax=Mycobacteroides franklinii TaxID=948102 RepID=A0A4R8R5T2_9MYCO|nr:putative oxidoreductase CzcO [Mycobacteroides franklinii]TDZ51465.1 putative oxidoreductase CzcO [Mycobacteroides franklinii]TDZ57886.1 putative oxidoreductase CzcO [Mycobacteroides franklinii]TDZ64827.1 putative oxidoreductase CzcO [Mycobacteroides franklinii]TDZ71225.1 putative oxidoreductase CzcO [Mycobacteroides franklinii]
MSQMCDAVVIGAGQSGLAAGKALLDRGLHPILLEADNGLGGAWKHYYDSLALFSPARYSGMVGMPFPGDPDRYPVRDEVIAYLRDYATRLDAEIRSECRVVRVGADVHGYSVLTDDGDVLVSPILIVATGTYGNPYVPPVSGAESFSGRQLHAGQYRAAAPFAGERVVVVGAGNSAVQIAVELAETAAVTLATRGRPRVVPQRPLGLDMHFWYARTGLDTAPVGSWLPRRPNAPVFDDGRYRAAIGARCPDRRKMFIRVDNDAVVWADGTVESVDTIVWATGYRPDVGYLAGLGVLDTKGVPRHRNGIAISRQGLGYVGLEWQRSLSSATLRGVGRDAVFVVDRLLRQQSRRYPSTPNSLAPLR